MVLASVIVLAYVMVLARTMVLANVTVLAHVMVLADVIVLACVMVLTRIMSPLRGSHGLSARRAQRTKSRVPKGLWLEVGARRALRLLVDNIHIQNFGRKGGGGEIVRGQQVLVLGSKICQGVITNFSEVKTLVYLSFARQKLM